MLPAAARLSRRRDFTSTVRAGRRTTRGSLVVSLAGSPGSDTAVPARVGFAVGRAVGGSVTRHLVTRRLRHLMADRLGRLAPGDRVVVRALPAAASSDSRQLARDLDAALDGLLRVRQ